MRRRRNEWQNGRLTVSRLSKDDSGDAPAYLDIRVVRIMTMIRSRLELTQEAVASALGITQSTLSKKERGMGTITASEWVLFCQLTGSPLDLPIRDWRGIRQGIRSISRSGQQASPLQESAPEQPSA